jgi:choice-of-anchor B domain-containing protein
MKLITALAFVCLLSLGAIAQNYSSQNISLVGHWVNATEPSEPVYGIRFQGIWGWHDDSTNREYAIMGSSTGCYFIDVTNPAAPVQVGYLPGRQQDHIWHEVKTYKNYCYIVSDDGGSNAFQIVDLQYLPDSIHVIHDGTTYFERCHTIYVDGDKLYGGSVTLVGNSQYYSMAVYSLANPEQPQLLATLDQFYTTPATVHDMFIRNDTCYVSGGFDGLFIYKFDTLANTFTELARLTSYPEQGYNHSSFLTGNGNTLIFMDEVPDGRGVKAVDVSNLGNITVTSVFRSNQGNTPHNPYIIGNDVLIGANYTDGVQIFNITDPYNVVRIGYFDTDTLVNAPNYTANYHGCWGAYTDLPSGLLIASDMQNGLYVLDIAQAILASTPEHQGSVAVAAYPNPFNDNFSVSIELPEAQNVRYSIVDVSGRDVMTGSSLQSAGTSLLEVKAGFLTPGAYHIIISGSTFRSSTQLIKTK